MVKLVKTFAKDRLKYKEIFRQENERLQAQNDRLREEDRRLREEDEKLREEVAKLRRELHMEIENRQKDTGEIVID